LCGGTASLPSFDLLDVVFQMADIVADPPLERLRLLLAGSAERP
jgi:hypothetical protein